MSRRHTDLVRRNIELHAKDKERLETLGTLMEAPTASEVIRRSLRIVEQMYSHQTTGGRIKMLFSDGSAETVKFL